MRITFATVLLLLFAACGGVSDNRFHFVEPGDLAGLQSLQAAQLLEFEDLTYTAFDLIPTRGEAIFNGVLEADAYINEASDPSFVGRLILEIEFGDHGAFATGEVRDIFSKHGQELRGKLSVGSSTRGLGTDPSIDRTVSIGLSGELTDTDGMTTSHTLRLEGDFYGSTVDHLGGVVLGRAENDVGSGTVTGRFTAKDTASD